MKTSDLENRYQRMYDYASMQLKEKKIELDHMIDDPQDKRFGVTLLIRPSEEVRQKIHDVLSLIKDIEPDQYYYPQSDMHITVLSIISCYQGFDIEGVNLEAIKQVIQSCLKDIKEVKIHFKGITASPSCVLIQGYPQKDTLEAVRNQLRKAFSKSKLELSIDKRYKLTTAHATVIRFRKPLHDYDLFCQMMDQYRTYDFGYSKIEQMELVLNDWYQRTERCQLLELYSLA